jgi:DNA invertase Pin-like site-specific DNA recombinase
MDPIQEAIKAIKSREEGVSFSYREVAKQFGVSRATLSRRHQGLTRSNTGASQDRPQLFTKVLRKGTTSKLKS